MKPKTQLFYFWFASYFGFKNLALNLFTPVTEHPVCTFAKCTWSQRKIQNIKMNYTTFVTTKYIQITHNKNIRTLCFKVRDI